MDVPRAVVTCQHLAYSMRFIISLCHNIKVNEPFQIRVNNIYKFSSVLLNKSLSQCKGYCIAKLWLFKLRQ